MEDISRELEREIAQSKPSPYKKSGKKSFLIVDDFGEIKSAGHLKGFVYAFIAISIICFFAAGGFYFLFNQKARENKRVKSELMVLKKKVESLAGEKEILMARLVISGKKPGISDQPSASDGTQVTVAKEKKAGVQEKSKKIISPAPVSQEKPVENGPKQDVNTKQSIIAKQEANAKKVTIPEVSGKENTSDTSELAASSPQHVVAIEKFAVTREGEVGNLLVRFDIRNMSDKPGGVSGRIFTILKPESRTQENWLVVPLVPLKNGIPSQYKRGQYFSIAHFKPVKFRIENQEGPAFYKKAAIYIFNEEGSLMFESVIDITEKEPR